MSRASELMDSRKFMAAMKDLMFAWTNQDGNQEVSDEEKAEALQAVLDMAIGAHTPQAPEAIHFVKDIDPGIRKQWTETAKPRGIKPLIPVPSVSEIVQQGVQGNLKADFEKSIKPKRKRRTKAEMAAARSNPDGPLQEHEKIKPQSADEVQKAQAPHITAMLKKVQDRADAIQTPTFDVAFSREEGMFIQELPVYLEAGGRFGVIENRGFNPQYGWVVKIGRK